MALCLNKEITFKTITQEIGKLKNENDIRCMRYCYSLLLRGKEQNEQNCKKKLEDCKKLHGVTIKVDLRDKKQVVLGRGAEDCCVNIRMGENGMPICDKETDLVDIGVIESRRTCTCFTEGKEQLQEIIKKSQSKGAVTTQETRKDSSPNGAITHQSIKEEIQKLKNEHDINCMGYCYLLLQRAKGEELHGVTIKVYCEEAEPITLSGGDGSHHVNIAMGHHGMPVCENEEDLVVKGIIGPKPLSNCAVHAITFQMIKEKIEKLENESDIRCMRYCYSLLRRAEEQNKADGKQNMNGEKGLNYEKKLHGVRMNVYCEGQTDPIILGSEVRGISVDIAMGPNGLPACQNEKFLVDNNIIEKDKKADSCSSYNEKKEKEETYSESEKEPGEETGPLKIPGAIEITCEPRISFRHIYEAKARVATEYGLTENNNIASLNRCITYIEHQKAVFLENATFIISCGNEVTVVLTSGKGKNVIEFAMNEKRKPIVKEINNLTDGSFKPGACGAPQVKTVKEFGYTVLSEATIDTLVADFQKWNLISEGDKRLLLFVKKIFKDREGESKKIACSDIKTNALITIKCEKFDVVLKAGNCYNICKVYMEQSKPNYKCKSIHRVRRFFERISMCCASDVLKDVKVGPFKLRFDDEETSGKDDDEGDDTEADDDNDDDD